MRVFGWLCDRQGVGYYRLGLPATQLANHGHHIAVDSDIPPWAVDGDVDVIVGQRVALPGPSRLWQQMAQDRRAKLVYELDDDLWNIEPDNRQAYRVFNADHVRRSSAFLDDGMTRRMSENIRVADVVTVSTEPLAELVSQWNPNVVVLPNMIPSWLLDQPMPNQLTERVTIGWGGSPTHARDFGEAAKPLKRVLQRFGDGLEFHCIGTDYTARVASRRTRTRHTLWFPSVDDSIRAIDYQIGIAPLRPSLFNSSKSDLKLLEYSALGIPSVVSYTGPYARAIDAGAPARFAESHKDWERELVALVQSPMDREQLGKEAREWASHRTIEEHWTMWEAAYAR